MFERIGPLLGHKLLCDSQDHSIVSLGSPLSLGSRPNFGLGSFVPNIHLREVQTWPGLRVTVPPALRYLHGRPGCSGSVDLTILCLSLLVPSSIYIFADDEAYASNPHGNANSRPSECATEA